MPADFLKCIKDGGKVRTLHMGGDKHMAVCYLKGKAYKGEVKHKVKIEKNKFTQVLSAK